MSMKCLFCQRETKHLNEKTHEEKQKELERLKVLDAFQGHDIINEIKLKKFIQRLRDDYCEFCTYDQLASMVKEHIERILRKTDL